MSANSNKVYSFDKGHFITVEGGEGAGKTTLIKKLKAYFIDCGYDVVVTREPGGTTLGDQIRQWVLNHNTTLKIDAKAELLLFLAARAQHIHEVISPAIEAGKIVICDRFNDSTVAYQGAARGLGVEWVRTLCNMICGEAVPALTLYLDVDPLVGLKRTRYAYKENAASGNIDRIESEKQEFHHRVRDAFNSFAKAEPKRFRTIDGGRTREYVFEKAVEFIVSYSPKD